MKKYGYHRITFATGRVVEGPIVVVLDETTGKMKWHYLQGEEPMVEWIGGSFLFEE